MKTRLLIVSGRLGIGGAERFISNLLMFLDKDKFDLHLYLGQDVVEYPVPDSITITRLGYSSIMKMPETIIRLRQVIKDWKPDLVLSAIGLANRWTGMALSGIGYNRPKWIARIGNNSRQGGRSDWRNRLNLGWDRYTYRNTDYFVVNSQGLKEQFQKLYPQSEGNLDVLYNPTDFVQIRSQALKPAEYAKASDTVVLMHAGRFHRQKRHDILIEAFGRLKERQDLPGRLELWLCGDGYLRAEIEADIRNRNLQDYVKLLGHLESPYGTFSQADMFLLASDWEGMPNVLVESMGLGIPVVSTDCPFGPAELIEDGVSGFLCSPSDSEALTGAIVRALTSPQLIEIAENGKKRVVEMFDFNVNMQKWQQALLRLHRN